MPVVQARWSIPHFVGVDLLPGGLPALALPPFPQFDLVVHVPQPATLQIPAGPKIRRHFGSSLPRLSLEQGPETSLASSNRGTRPNVYKRKAGVTHREARNGPSGAIGDELQEPICGPCPQRAFGIVTIIARDFFLYIIER